jgi:hypothetical protein
MLMGVLVSTSATAEDDPISVCASETQSNDSAITTCLQQRVARLGNNVAQKIDDEIEAAKQNADFNNDVSRKEWIGTLEKLKAAYASYSALVCKTEGMYIVGGPANRQEYFSCLIKRHLSELARLADDAIDMRSGKTSDKQEYDGHTCATVVATSDGFLAIRTRPTTASPMIGQLKTGDFIDVAACPNCSDPWRRISHIDWPKDSDGAHPLVGWVNGAYLKDVPCGDEP